MVRRILRFLFGTVLLVLTVTVGVPVAVAATVLGSFLFLPLPAVIPQPKALAPIVPTQVYDRNGNLIADLPAIRPEHSRQEGRHPPGAEGSGRLGRGPQLLQARRRRHPGQPPGLRRRHPQREGVAGRLDHHPAVREAGLHRRASAPSAARSREAVLASQIDRQTSKDEILYRYLSTVYFGDGSYGDRGGGRATTSGSRSASSPSPRRPCWPGSSPRPARGRPARTRTRPRPTGRSSSTRCCSRATSRQQAHDAGHGPEGVVAGRRAGRLPAATVVYPFLADPTEVPGVRRLRRALADRQVRRRSGLPGRSAGPDDDRSGRSRRRPTRSVHQRAGRHRRTPGDGPGRRSSRRPASSRPSSAAASSARARSPTSTWRSAAATEPPARAHTVEVAATCWNGKTVTAAAVGRQPGSAWKPFVLATAFSKGISPTTVYPAPVSSPCPAAGRRRPDSCTIGNDEGQGGGRSDLRHATWYSINTVYAQLVSDVGCKDTGEMAKRLGVDLGVVQLAGPDLQRHLRPRRGGHVAPRHGLGLRHARQSRRTGPSRHPS